MGFWDTVASTVIALVVVGILGSLGTLIVAWVRGRLGRRPDFVLDLVRGDWYLTRPRRQTAFEVRYWMGGPDNTNVVPPTKVFSDDMTRAERFSIPELRDNPYFGVSWIDGRGRRSAEVEIEPGVKQYRLIAERPRRRRIGLKY